MKIHITAAILLLSSYVHTPLWAIRKVATAQRPGISVAFKVGGLDYGIDRLDFGVNNNPKTIDMIKSELLTYMKVRNGEVTKFYIKRGVGYEEEEVTQADQVKNDDTVQVYVEIEGTVGGTSTSKGANTANTANSRSSPLGGSSWIPFKPSKWHWSTWGIIIVGTLVMLGVILWLVKGPSKKNSTSFKEDKKKNIWSQWQSLLSI